MMDFEEAALRTTKQSDAVTEMQQALAVIAFSGRRTRP
jgi:hypothetical protein